MALTSTTILSIVELTIYIILVPIVLYLLVRHGKTGILGWAYLIVFCVLRIVSDGIQISDRNLPNGTSTTGAVINSIGLSPLLLGYGGIMHECYHRIQPHNQMLSLILGLSLHVLVVAGVALAANGGSNLAKPQTASNSWSKAHSDQEAGAVLLFLSWIFLVLYTLYAFRRLRTMQIMHRSALRLAKFGMAALPFMGARSAYTLAYAFDHSPSLNPVTGSFALKLTLIFLVQLIAALFLIAGGFWTRSMKAEDQRNATSSNGPVYQQTPGDP